MDHSMEHYGWRRLVEVMVHFSNFDMSFVRSREEVDYQLYLAELIHIIVEAEEVSERADVLLWYGDLVMRNDWFLAGHNY